MVQRFPVRAGGPPGGWTLWIPLVLTAALFGAAHLPRWAETTALTVPLAVAVLLLNGSGALVFGLVFARKGLESTILAHFAADLVLHVIGAPILAHAV